MLSPTKVINYIEKRLGFRFNDLELSADEILKNIRTDSLVVFSKYFPYQERLRIDVKNDVVPGYINRYFLRCESEVLNVNRIVGIGTMGSDAIGAYIHPAAMMQMMQDPISMQMSADLLSLTKNPVTFVYYHPNQVEIAPNYYVSSNYIVVCNTVHHDHFGTIPTNLENEFLQLAYADTCINLLAIRTRFSNLQNTFGSLELNTDLLNEGKDLRNDLIEKFTKNALLYNKRKKLIIA